MFKNTNSHIYNYSYDSSLMPKILFLVHNNETNWHLNRELDGINMLFGDIERENHIVVCVIYHWAIGKLSNSSVYSYQSYHNACFQFPTQLNPIILPLISHQLLYMYIQSMPVPGAPIHSIVIHKVYTFLH